MAKQIDMRLSSLWLGLFFLIIATGYTSASISSEIILSSEYFLSNYANMLSAFKIFIYPQIPGYADADFRSSAPGSPQTSTDVFFQTLLGSNFITEDPEAAHLFLIPISIEAMHAKMRNQSVARHLRDVVGQIRELYPFWQRTLGADHFIISCTRFKTYDMSRNLLELQKNSIWLACAEMFGGEDPSSDESQFFPHKDVAMPPFPHVRITQEPSTHQPNIMTLKSTDARDGQQEEEFHRPFLVYMIDNPRGTASSTAIALREGDNDFLLQSSNSIEMLSNSKFCLAFASMGQRVITVRAMRMGCVPIIVSYGYLHGLPFQDILDWQRFAVIVSRMHLRRLKTYLSSMPEAKYREMQAAAREASAHFEWNVPPKPFDSFHMLIYQLWSRRHTIRYIQRSPL